ncbi:MAG: uroporphyrinogen-III synthase [Thermomicrobiales bacterium]
MTETARVADARTLPLAGRRIVVTRASDGAGELAGQLERLGAEPVLCPTIAVAPPETYAPLDAALRRAGEFAWIVVTSANGVAALLARLAALGCDGATLAGVRLAAVGPATAAALGEAGLAAFVPATHTAAAIAAGLGDLAGQQVLLPLADIAPDTLADELRARGAIVERVTAYRTIPDTGPMGEAVARLLCANAIDALTFTSGSTVRALLDRLAWAELDVADLIAQGQWPATVCIGPTTAQVARECGLPVAAVAAEHTLDGLIAALCQFFGAPGAQEAQ